MQTVQTTEKRDTTRVAGYKMADLGDIFIERVLHADRRKYWHLGWACHKAYGRGALTFTVEEESDSLLLEYAPVAIINKFAPVFPRYPGMHIRTMDTLLIRPGKELVWCSTVLSDAVLLIVVYIGASAEQTLPRIVQEPEKWGDQWSHVVERSALGG